MKLISALYLLLLPFAGMSQDTPMAIKAPQRFIEQAENKATKYYRRLQSKTEKTLTKLARWEERVKNLLQKASPETAQRLFAPGQPSFASLLEQYRKGQTMANQYGQQYDEYRDRLKNTMGYLSAQQSKAKEAHRQLQKLDSLANDTEAMQRFIKERKRLLMDQCLRHIGRSKWLKKMDKESYYYIETLRNYKALFQDEKKVEELAMRLLRKLPGFENFLQRNSAVAGLFGFGQNVGAASGPPNLAGLQTRASVSALIQNQLAAGGPGAQQAFRQNVQQAQAQLSQLKDRISQAGGGDGELPSFKPNNQKAKTFWQRLEYTANIGFGRLNPLALGTQATTGAGARTSSDAVADIALGVGYKLNDKSTVGIAASCKLGLGSIQRVRFSGQGLGLRSFIDWKLKKQFYISGGYEMNYLPRLESLRLPSPFGTRNADVWQRSALLGISKKMKINSKWAKLSQVQLLYDFLHDQHRPQGQAWIFRVGYSFK
jgi:hypothetical protein